MAYKGKYKGSEIDAALDKAITALQSKDIEGLQPIIADLETIRSNAAKGATALQSIPDEYVTDTEAASTYIPLSGGSLKPDASLKFIKYGNRTVEINGNEITLDMSNADGGWAGAFAQMKHLGGMTTMLGFYGGNGNLTHIFMGGSYNDPALKMTPDGIFTFSKQLNVSNLNGHTPITSGNIGSQSVDKATNDADGNNIKATYATKSELNGKQSTITDLDTIRSGASAGATAVQPSGLAKVATSGSYNDLSNKPTIPSAVTESTVAGWGFTKNTGTYSKPSTGIPASDLASAVQTSLGKADTALQYPAYPVVIMEQTPTVTINPNTLYKWGTVTSLDITLGPKISGVVNEYIFEFIAISDMTLILRPGCYWANNEPPIIESGKRYQVSIVNDLGIFVKFNPPD